MRVAVAKPDWGVQGGFEILLGRLVSHLESVGHQVSMLTVAGAAPDHVVDGQLVDDSEWSKSPDAYTYESLLDRFSRVDASGFDLLITTQPGSWAVAHPRKLAIFYHHQRVFYDLADEFAAAQDIDQEKHRVVCDRVQARDLSYSASINRFLAPSRTVADRLKHFWNIGPAIIDEFHAGPISAVAVDGGSSAMLGQRSEVICVSRSEFTKRTELFVAAAHSGFNAPATLVGGGGQLPAVRRWAAEKAAGLQVDDRPWERRGTYERVEVVVPSDPVAIVGRLNDDELFDRYSNALCLVAPAHSEDYGLTALEAFTHGVPVVVCDDGGGLVEFVDDGVNGLIVEPAADAIAESVRSIVDDDTMAQRLRQGALATATRFTWDRAHAQLDSAIASVMDSHK